MSAEASIVDVLEGRATWALLHDDCAKVLPLLPSDSVDALVTDPPAGIGFMQKGWDSDKGGRDAWVAWLAGVMREALRVMKPGAHGLVWALPRTSHWTGWALESAGFEVRDRIAHLFGTGFPKSLNLPGGLGTALKPACEDWWLIRKPLAGTVAGNVAAHGTGALNIDACRIGTEARPLVVSDRRTGNVTYGDGLQGSKAIGGTTLGRWPANVTLDESAARALDEQSGTLHARGNKGASKGGGGMFGHGLTINDFGSGDSGGASRFFYVAKPTRSERDAGCGRAERKSGAEATGRKKGSAGLDNPRSGAQWKSGAKNFHPTVKSLELMSWLVRLITPPGGVVLDCFAGSGSTGAAALIQGFRFIGGEQSPEYIELARGRLARAAIPVPFVTKDERQIPLFEAAP